MAASLPDLSGASLICADVLDYDAMAVGVYQSISQSGAWTSPSGSARGDIWKWPVDSTGALIGTRVTVGAYPVSPGLTQQAINTTYPETWALGFAFTGGQGFDTEPSPMNRFTPQVSLAGVWSGAYCNRVACSLAVDSSGSLNGRDTGGCVYSGTLAGDLTSVARATVTGCNGVTYTGLAVVVPHAAGPGYVDWSAPWIVILGSAGAAGQLVISNEGVPRVPTIGPPPVPTVSLSAAPNPVQPGQASVLTWSSANVGTCYGASGWPTSDVLTPSGFVTTAPLTATTSYTIVCSSANGNATASITVNVATPAPPTPPGCVAPQVLIGGTCQLPPSVSVTLSIAPTTVVDSSLGCPSPAGEACDAVVPITTSSTLAGDSVECSAQGGGWINSAIGYSVGPYTAQMHGPQVITINCVDAFTPYGQAGASASITLTVTPPNGPPADTFSGILNGNVETLTWSTPVSGPGCYVQQADTNGNVTTLTQGGGTSGSATSGFLSPSNESFTFTLYCGGSPDAGVPAITVSP